MSDRRLPPPLEAQLEHIARQYRRRRRLRGLVQFALAFLAVLGLLALGLPGAEAASLPLFLPLGLALLLLAGLAWRWLYLPARRKIAPEQVALLVDALHPELENLTISSVEFSREDYRATSAWIVEHVLDDARIRAARIDLAALADPRPLGRLALGGALLWLAALALLAVLLQSWDLERLRDGLFRPAALRPTFSLEPGDVRVRRGADLVVWVRGAEQGGAIRWRSTRGDWQSGALLPGSARDLHYFHLRALHSDTDYQVQVGGQRSRIHRIEVWSPPAVASIDLSYHYPAYLEWPPLQVAGGGPISGPEGTAVDIEVVVDRDLAQARLLLASGDSIALARAGERRWRARLLLHRDDAYDIALEDLQGERNEPAPPHPIAVQVDAPPAVRVRAPRGDGEATLLEEIPFAFEVTDDYGLGTFGLYYEVAGREPVRLPLHGGAAPTRAEGRYLLALEELDLAPGDLVTWAVWAEDRKPGRPAHESLGDPFFLEIRPFQRSYSQAVSNQGGGAGQTGPEAAADQKEILIATWNLRRDAPELGEEEFAARLGAIVRAQRQVLGRALEGAPPPAKAHLVAALQEEVAAALQALEGAALPRPEAALSRAAGHQQRAYRHLLQMEPEHYEIAQRGDGGPAARSSARQRQLEGLEVRRRRDFSEQASTLQQQLAAADRARESLEELTRRQEFIGQDIDRLVSEPEADAAAEQRRLEKLRQEQRRALAELDAAGGRLSAGDLEAGQARQVREPLDRARRQMQRSAESLESGQPQQARAAAGRALEALRQARQDLEQLSRTAAARRMRQLREQLDSLRTRQEHIAGRARALQESGPSPRSLETDQGRTAELLADKEALAAAFAEFMGAAGDLAHRAAASQGLMARQLGDWLRRTSRQGIYEDMLKGREYARYGAWQAAADLEAEIAARLARAAAALDSVAARGVATDLESRQRALEQIRPLAEQEAALQRPEALQRFAAEGYRDWAEALRRAEDLLPAASAARRGLESARAGVEALGRAYARDRIPPRYELVLEQALKPLAGAAAELRREIGRLRGERELPDEGEIPARYRAHIAEYFRALSELEER